MRRHLTTLAALAALAATVALAPTAVAYAKPAQPAAPLAACAGTISITSLTFDPPNVAAGVTSTSTATLVARNCTFQRQQVTATWLGRFADPATGPAIPPGCPGIDPLPLPMDFPARGSLSRSVTYLVFATCTATVLHLTVTISKGGQVLATRSADLQITR